VVNLQRPLAPLLSVAIALLNYYASSMLFIAIIKLLRLNMRAIMGVGVALQARSRYPELEVTLSKLIRDHGLTYCTVYVFWW
jgi:hypothetical protein